MKLLCMHSIMLQLKLPVKGALVECHVLCVPCGTELGKLILLGSIWEKVCEHYLLLQMSVSLWLGLCCMQASDVTGCSC
jgi:hypothetical protein